MKQHENVVVPDCMQLVIRRPFLPAFDEVLDSSVFILIPWLKAKGIVKDEVLIDRRCEPNFNVCFSTKEIRSRLGGRSEENPSLTDSLKTCRFVDPKSSTDQTRFPHTTLMRS